MTFIYALINVPVSLILGLALAVLLNKQLKGIKFFRVIYYLPTIVPSVAAIILWQFMFKSDTGLLNGMLRQIGLPAVGWLTDEKVVLLSLSLIKWWGVGGMMIIFLSGLQSVPVDVYEAADLDGASGWQKFKSITLPMIITDRVLTADYRSDRMHAVLCRSTDYDSRRPELCISLYQLRYLYQCIFQ